MRTLPFLFVMSSTTVGQAQTSSEGPPRELSAPSAAPSAGSKQPPPEAEAQPRVTRSRHASGDEKRDGPRDDESVQESMIPIGWFISPGLNVALSHGRAVSPGFVFGGELSVVHLGPQATWWGGYVDWVHDFGADETRLTVGPELGAAYFGIDGGYLLSVREGVIEHGLTLRPMLTVGVATLYYRAAILPGTRRPYAGEVGLLFKLPLPITHD